MYVQYVPTHKLDLTIQQSSQAFASRSSCSYTDSLLVPACGLPPDGAALCLSNSFSATRAGSFSLPISVVPLSLRPLSKSPSFNLVPLGFCVSGGTNMPATTPEGADAPLPVAPPLGWACAFLEPENPMAPPPDCFSRSSDVGAGLSLVALEVSVVFVVVEAEGCLEAAALGFPAPKEPSLCRDSAARESDVTTPTASWMGCLAAGSLVTCRVGLGKCDHARRGGRAIPFGLRKSW